MPHSATPTLDALDELAEVFVGLSHELEWSTSEEISRKELLPILHMCRNKTLTPEQTLDVVVSLSTVKRNETFAVLLKIVQRLNTQLAEYTLVKKYPVSNGNADSGGDEPA